jgi:hypothetical protein
LKIKEYLLACSDLQSENDLDIVFESIAWARPAGHMWSSARNYFSSFPDDINGITMTADTPTKFWRAWLTPGGQLHLLENQQPSAASSIGLLTIRASIRASTCTKHRRYLETTGFLEDGPGYWSYNFWSE